MNLANRSEEDQDYGIGIFGVDDISQSLSQDSKNLFFDLYNHLVISVYWQRSFEKSNFLKFLKLKHQWEEETKFLSSVDEITRHPAYQEIVRMGESVVPCILRELRKKPGLWFWALSAITREDPILPEHRGNIKEMTNDWVIWGKGQALTNL